jgi:hypothetical protein
MEGVGFVIRAEMVMGREREEGNEEEIGMWV